LHLFILAGQRVGHHPLPPPAAFDQQGRQILAERFQRRAIDQRGVDAIAEVAQQIDAHCLGHGECCLMLFLPYVAVIEADAKAFLLKKRDSLLRRQAKDVCKKRRVSHARLIARFCAERQPEPWQAPSASEQTLKVLAPRLDALRATRVQEGNRLDVSREAVRGGIAQHID
jgi:adenylate kinase